MVQLLLEHKLVLQMLLLSPLLLLLLNLCPPLPRTLLRLPGGRLLGPQLRSRLLLTGLLPLPSRASSTRRAPTSGWRSTCRSAAGGWSTGGAA